MLECHCSPAQEATLRRTASRNFLIRQKRTRRVFHRAFKARQRDELLASRRGGRAMARGGSGTGSGFDSVYDLSDGEGDTGSEQQSEWGGTRGAGRPGKASFLAKQGRARRGDATMGTSAALFEGDSFVDESAFMPGLAERPCVCVWSLCA